MKVPLPLANDAFPLVWEGLFPRPQIPAPFSAVGMYHCGQFQRSLHAAALKRVLYPKGRGSKLNISNCFKVL